MIRDDELPELPQLRNVEAEFTFRIDDSFADQVIASTNDSQPMHRRYPAAGLSAQDRHSEVRQCHPPVRAL